MRLSFDFQRPGNVTLGDRARDAGLWQEAARHYRKALRRNPHNPPILVQYGNALKEVGQLAEAEEAYRRAISCAPGMADTHLQLARILKLAGKSAEACQAYWLAFVLDPTGEDARRELLAVGWPEEQVSGLVDALMQHHSTTPECYEGGQPESVTERQHDNPELTGLSGTSDYTGIDNPYGRLLDRIRVEQEVYGSRINPNDVLCRPGHEIGYYDAGRDALWNVLQSMISADLPEAHDILDFPCGFGRVTRYLRAAFPNARIDLLDESAVALAHCAGEYNAFPLDFKADFGDIQASSYDLIFSTALLDRLPELQAVRALDFFTAHLRIGGIVILSLPGRRNLLTTRQCLDEAVFGSQEHFERVAQDYTDGKYAFLECQAPSGGGRSFVPVAWFQQYVAKNPQLIIVRFREGSRDDNQDMVTLKRLF